MPDRRVPPARRRDPRRVDPHVGTRVEAFVQGADLGRVAAILAASRDEVLRRWLEAARLQPFHALHPDRAVADSIPPLFDALVAFLEKAAPRSVDPDAPLDDPAVRAAAQDHARARFEQGLGPADVLSEFRLLRQEIGRVLRAGLSGAGTADVVGAELLVHDALDGAATLGLAALEAQEDERRRLAAEVVRLAAEKEQALEAARFLAEAGALLAGSLDPDATLASVAQLAVPRLADWCVAYLVDAPEGQEPVVRRVTAVHADPAKDATLRELLRLPLSSDPSHPVRRALAERRTYVSEPVPREQADRHPTEAEHARTLRALGTTSATVVPLVARGRAIGALSFGRADDAPVDRALAEELAARAALAVDNAWLYEQAQEALRERERLLTVVAHDLKAPLTTIKGNADLLQRRAMAGHVDAERVAGHAGAIAVAAEAMAAQVGELLDAARLRAGQPLDLVRRPTDLVALVYRVVARVLTTSGEHQIEVDAAEPELVGAWDAFRLERVLGNLLSNAVKYSPAGREVRVEVWREERDGQPWACLAVRDQGIGIPAADLPHVFEPYRRGSNVGAVEGEGLGLAGARQIVEQHGGAIDAESREGEGATFTVRLPLPAPDD